MRARASTPRPVSSKISLLLLLFLPCPLAAQDRVLDEIEALTKRGEAGEARTMLGAWWTEKSGQASREDFQRGLYLRGRLAIHADSARVHYLRLIVEHAGGPYSAPALLRLAQDSHARGDLPGAARHFRSLVRDYPESAQRSEAQAWLDEFGASADAEAEREDSPKPKTTDPPAEDDPLPQAPPLGKFAVQLGAFSEPDRARELMSRAKKAGFEARAVRVEGSDLVRVRIGRFAEREAADEVLREVRSKGFNARISTDADKEKAVG